MIRSKLIVNETYEVDVNDGHLYINEDDGTALCVIDLKAVPDLLKAIQMVLDENTGSSEPKQKS